MLVIAIVKAVIVAPSRRIGIAATYAHRCPYSGTKLTSGVRPSRIAFVSPIAQGGRSGNGPLAIERSVTTAGSSHRTVAQIATPRQATLARRVSDRSLEIVL